MTLGNPWCKRLVTLAAVLTLAGCGVTERIGKRMDDSWAADLLADSEQLILTSDAGTQLNPGHDGTPLSVVMRVYQLTDLQRFSTSDANTLWLDVHKALGETFVESREITLLPGLGQVDRWPLLESTRYIGVAAFFRDERSARWKVAFDAGSLRKDGIWLRSGGLRVLADRTELAALRGVDVLDRPQAIPDPGPVADLEQASEHGHSIFNPLADGIR